MQCLLVKLFYLLFVLYNTLYVRLHVFNIRIPAVAYAHAIGKRTYAFVVTILGYAGYIHVKIFPVA